MYKEFTNKHLPKGGKQVNMLFKELLKALVTVRYYSIRIDTYDYDTNKTIKENIYSMDKIPSDYDNSKVLTIHTTSDSYDGNLYQYHITVYK
ncbi:MAG: hypothetical protein QXF82_02920 [Nitrososphaeria archaeon]